MPQPTPYLAGRTAADFINGSNLAIGGSTALEPAFLEARGVTSFVLVALSYETRWFENVLQLLVGSASHHGNTNRNNHAKIFDQMILTRLSEATAQLSITASSVFFVGEMGINDYFLSLFSNHTVDGTASLVPHVVGAIRSALAVS